MNQSQENRELSRRTLLKTAALNTTSLLAINLGLYVIGSMSKLADGKLVAGAKMYSCSCSYDGSNGGTAFGSCDVCQPCATMDYEMSDQDVNSNCAPVAGATCGHMYQTCQP